MKEEKERAKNKSEKKETTESEKRVSEKENLSERNRIDIFLGGGWRLDRNC